MGINKSNVHGWHSKDFDLNELEPKFFTNSISPILNESINDMGWDLEKNKIKITAMWSIINKKNDSNIRHIHPNNFISASKMLHLLSRESQQTSHTSTSFHFSNPLALLYFTYSLILSE